MCNKSLCKDCKLRVGDYCFSENNPEEILGEITKCDEYIGDSVTTYYEFIDGYQYCIKTKKIPAVKIIENRAKNEILRRLKVYLSIDPKTIDLRKAIEILINEESDNE